MLYSKLFLGMAVKGPFADFLSKADQQKVTFFLEAKKDYLHSIDEEGVRYLGKMVEGNSDLASLELLEANIISILKKVVPEFPFEEAELELFPIVLKENDGR